MINFELRTLILFLIVLVLVISTFGFVIRKLLGVERKKWFSYNHLNERHKKLDWTVRIIFLSLLLISSYYMIYNDTVGIPWYFETWFILIIFLITSEMLRAFMEWRYADNKRDFVVTIAEMMFMISIVFLTIKTDFFGLFNI
ncbi:cation transport ATPase [Lysinibacillus sp. RC79]